MGELGPLVGSGRSADVFAYGPGKVLRRYREPRDAQREAAAMEHARTHGFPAPVARAVNSTDIVMDRVEGPTMLADLARRPWSAPRHAATLAELHDRLHAMVAPDWLPAALGEGVALLHLDLHPDNVILSSEGPMVIDWPNAAKGPPAGDVAHTCLVLACAASPGGFYQRAVSGAGRRLFLSLFLRHFDRAEVQAMLGPAAAHRLATRPLPEPEREAIAQLLESPEPNWL